MVRRIGSHRLERLSNFSPLTFPPLPRTTAPPCTLNLHGQRGKFFLRHNWQLHFLRKDRVNLVVSFSSVTDLHIFYVVINTGPPHEFRAAVTAKFLAHTIFPQPETNATFSRGPQRVLAGELSFLCYKIR